MKTTGSAGGPRVMPSSLCNRVALITGVSRAVGIGSAIARELAGAGADLFLTGHRAADANPDPAAVPHEPPPLVDELRALGRTVAYCDLDLADPAAPARLFRLATQVFGRIDILINNAAHWEAAPIDTLDAGCLDRHHAVNVRGAALLCAEFARHSKATRDAPTGRIINLTSGQGRDPMPGELAYVATKGAIDALTLSLSAELGPRGITVNAVDPGPTDTAWMSPTLNSELERRALFARVGLPADAARIIRFLATEEAAWITGQIIRSRGGF
jgi:3-oxoacyl-[acyl-carrier protein] reductase